jgi:hypothetical protein
VLVFEFFTGVGKKYRLAPPFTKERPGKQLEWGLVPAG